MDALEPARTAIVLIDLQRRIVAQPVAPHSGAEVVARCVTLADAARAGGALVVVVRAERPGVDAQPAGSELVPEVAPKPGDLEIVKHTWGAFQDTGLDAALRERGVDTLVVAGLATNFGVEQTARIGDETGYRVVLPQDAMSGLDAYAHDFAVDYVFRRLARSAPRPTWWPRWRVDPLRALIRTDG
ncbi:isochorismatase family protein [Micromonospora sp. BL4]|uniref:isochorismatase family protein n=1 Tax=Micromonospora sp. BL4 TaxID=2478710 RepID=UPI001F47CC88|nr:isochorismatase family protein [Micromonospora sp. BL4]